MSLNTIDVLPDLIRAGVSALKIEGRQRGKAYVQQVTREFRTAIDAVLAGQGTGTADTLAALTEGHRSTTGAYRKTWR